MNARGIKELNKYELGEKLSLKQSVLAKCAECTCKYADGKADCVIPECPLYPYMVYGTTWKGREKKIIPVSQVKAMRQGLKRVRNSLS